MQRDCLNLRHKPIYMQLTLRFQTAPNLPPPYAYQYELVLQSLPEALHADLKLTYLDREELDAEEIEAEGFTTNDNYAWAGELDNIWQEQAETLLKKTDLKTYDNQNDNQDFIELEWPTDNEKAVGSPQNHRDWLYLAQEMLQAIFETSGKERAFELAVLQNSDDKASVEASMTASFSRRSAQIRRVENGISSLRYYAWHALPELMETLYAPDYEMDNVPTQKPTHKGLFINLGDGTWYEVGKHVVEPSRQSKTLVRLRKMLFGLLG